MKPDTLDEFKIESRHYPLVFLLVATATTVLAYDIYYLLYIKEAPLQYLDENEFSSFPLESITPVNKDTSLFRFRANIPDFKDMPTPSHVILKDDTCQVARSYTPITYGRQYFDILIKRYEDGQVSRFVHGLEEGRKVEMRGPILSFPYERNMAPEIGMICGGTGITPMYQLIKKILRDPDDESRISLLYASKSEDDILLRRELDILADGSPDRFKVYYMLDKPPKDWDQGRGIISKTVLKDKLPGCDDSIVLVCGPDAMVKHVAGPKLAENNQGPLKGLLKDLKYTAQNVFKF